MKSEQILVYPNIADNVMQKILLPVLPEEMRDQYARPDTIRMYIPPELDEESDEDKKREHQRTLIKQKYRHKRIERVVKKFKNATGQVKYTVLWENNPVEEARTRS
ncbi:hypothetical protein CU098_013476 [Rhizopus stolonifer]|uniref:Chromo domain-containing protein n=1 Tax=Rhizopus stolonifer TaxID=4846 RepID=A0A367KVP1_RHIST|nr:hypothetical protein CU098_013476 [Rhizopus stolonifer]